MSALTWGHVVALIGLADLIAAVWFASSWWRVRDYGYGTPLYARGREAKRLALVSAAGALLILAVAVLTPLWELELL